MLIKSILKKTLNSLGYEVIRDDNLPVGYNLGFDLKRLQKFGQMKVVFDVGGNRGQTVKAFSEMFGESTIYSFEPIPDTFKVLKKNTSTFLNVKLFQHAFGDENKTMEVLLYSQEKSELNSLKQEAMNDESGAKNVTVEVKTIDSFLEAQDIDTIDLLKIDTEGYEFEVIRGAQSAFEQKKIKALILETCFNRNKVRNTYFFELNKLLEGKGFQFMSFYDISRIQYKWGYHYANALFVRQDLLG